MQREDVENRDLQPLSWRRPVRLVDAAPCHRQLRSHLERLQHEAHRSCKQSKVKLHRQVATTAKV
eukprot:5642570-Prymnesium_polylepis.1